MMNGDNLGPNSTLFGLLEMCDYIYDIQEIGLSMKLTLTH